MTTSRKFDLNIEKILEGWEISHAIREVIANALDEQVLTKTKQVERVAQSLVLQRLCGFSSTALLSDSCPFICR